MPILNAFTDDEKTKLAALGHFANGYYVPSVSTSISIPGDFEKVILPLTGIVENGFTWNGTLDRWENNSGVDILASIFVTLTGSHDDTVASHKCTWAIFLSGVQVPNPPSAPTISKSSTNSVTLMVGACTVPDGAYIELYATMDSADSVITENCEILIR